MSFGGGADALNVRAGPRLGNAVGGEEEFIDHRREPLLFLLLGPRDDDRALRESIRLHGGAYPGARPGRLLGDETSLKNSQTQSAVLLGDVRVHESQLPCLLTNLARVLGSFIETCSVRSDFFFSKLVGKIAKLLLFLTERKVDHGLSPTAGWPSFSLEPRGALFRESGEPFERVLGLEAGLLRLLLII